MGPVVPGYELQAVVGTHQKMMKASQPGQNPQIPQAQKPQIPIYGYRTEQGNPVSLMMRPRSLEELARYTPSRTRAHIVEQCMNKKGVVKSVAMQFIPEAFSFHLGVASLAAMEGDHSPAALAQFVHETSDPLAIVSFGGFMLGNRATVRAFQMMGWAFDPCNGFAKSFTQAAAQTTSKVAAGISGYKRFRPVSATKAQLRFGHLVGPLGMAVGLLGSSAIHELGADPEAMTCAQSYFQDLKACDIAYNRWITSKKLYQYVPEIMGMTATSLAIAYALQPVVNGALGLGKSALGGTATGLSTAATAVGSTSLGKAVGKTVAESAVGAVAKSAATVVAESAAKVLEWKSVRLAFGVGRWATGPTLSLGLSIYHTDAFLWLQETYFSPPVRSAWQTWSHGKEIVDSSKNLEEELARLEDNNWVWQPTNQPRMARQSGIPDPCTSSEKVAAYGDPESKCKVKTLSELIRERAKTFSEWRSFLMQGAMMAQQSWAEYVVHFQNTYTAAYAFYNVIIESIAGQRLENRNKTGNKDGLYRGDAKYGVFAITKNENGEFVKDGTIDMDKAIQEAASYLETNYNSGPNADRLAPYHQKILRRIHRALRMNDRSREIPGLSDPNSEFSQMLQQVPADQRDFVKEQIRNIELEKNLNLLNIVLAGDPTWGDKGRPINDRYVEKAKENPFMQLRLMLGTPRPIPEGLVALGRLENNNFVINQEMKNLHPAGIGTRVTTPSMTQYLLASMVCGPDANPSKEIKVQEFRNNMNLLSRFWRTLTIPYGREMYEHTDEIKQLAEDAKTPKASWFGSQNDDLALVPQTAGFAADFSPPRLIQDLGIDFCNELPHNSNPLWRNYQVYAGLWNIKGATYSGFLPIVKTFIRPEFFSSDGTQSMFDEWWTKNVDPAVRRVADDFKRRFDTILEEEFYPALSGQGGHIAADIGNQLNKKYYGEKISIGIGPTLMEEAHVYLNLIERVRLDGLTDKELEKARNEFSALRFPVSESLRLMTGLFGSDEETSKGAIEAENYLARYEKDFVKKFYDIEKRDYEQNRKIIRTRERQAYIADLLKKLKKNFHAAIKAMGGNVSTNCSVVFQLPGKHEEEEATEKGAPGAPLAGPAAGKEESKKAVREEYTGRKEEILTVSFELLSKLATEADVYLKLVNTVNVDTLDRSKVAKETEKSLKDSIDEVAKMIKEEAEAGAE